MTKTVFAHTPPGSNFPPFVNLSRNDGGGYTLTVRSQGNGGSDIGSIVLSPENVEALAADALADLHREPVASVALPVVDPGPDSLEREIQAKANRAPRVTPADVKAEIVGETFTLLPSGRVTVCELTLKNGFTVRGESAVVFIENFDEGIGRKVARDNAEKEVWQLLGFRLRDEQADAAADLADVKLVPPHQQRVVDEKRELDERLSKLDAFILDNPLYLQLSTDEQDRLSRQSKAMAAYSGILDERIAHF
ncbi:MAG: hypothetical protein IV104_12960 [Acidovorax sp.]|nr:hypothetical protein [Acidovorax sp.]